MKKINVMMLALACAVLTSCGSLGALGGTTGESTSNGSGALGGILDILSNPNTIGNVISSVIGTNKVTPEQLIGSWKYSGPGVAFTSEKALANAGGEVVAAQIKQKIQPTFNNLGISASNTTFTFAEDKSFSCNLRGIPLQGTYTYDEASAKISFKTLLFSFNGYAKRNADGIAILFEAKQLLKVLQTAASLTGNQTIEVISEVSKQYDNVRLGFDVKK